MKSTKLVVGGILSIALLFGGCAKEEIIINQDNATVDHTETVRSITALSNDFVASQTRLTQGQNRAIPRWLKIVGHDVFGGTVGFLVGGIGGSIIGGSGCSLLEAGRQRLFGSTIDPGAGNG